jgi:sugar transferase (PEP-CTERM system associated)
MDTVRLFGHYVQARTLLLGVFQAALTFGAVYLAAFLLQAGIPLVARVQTRELLPQAATFAFVLMGCMFSLGLYQVRLRDGLGRILLRVALSFVLAIPPFAAVTAVFPSLYPGEPVFGASVILALVGLGVTHVGFFELVDRELLKRRVLFYGAGQNAAALLSRLRRRSDRRLFTLVGCVGLSDDVQQVAPGMLIRTHQSLADYVRDHHINEVVITMDNRRGRFPTKDLLACRFAGVEVTDMLSFYERHTGRIKCELLKPSDIIFADGFRRGAARDVAKRILDVVVAGGALALTWPLIVLAALAIKLEDGFSAPVFYRQTRVGQDSVPFTIAKMRSMRVDAETGGKAQWATADDDRITRVGAYLRKYRIDELPQLYSVLKGDMSLVGPRPERPEFVESLSEQLPYYGARHCVKPGVTGWAQLCYPYGSSVEDALQKLEFDLYYVKNSSLFLDLVIILGTVEVILFGKGAR